ncbi:VOC family protein [Taibaiella koreensis]|uniref:VOC family protein n=1 Tax=Taibaiella koreensis TaxID=1268548 RepID=UPI000E59D18A|nr:VOC family protein [Taibaiella koreensis]
MNVFGNSTQKIATFLWFNNEAEEAMNFYTSLFDNSRIVSVKRTGDQVLAGTFELAGQQFIALNGGPQFPFTEAVSLFVKCDSQEEVDFFWNKLTADGGQESRCGWLKDKFGLSWQIVPTRMGELLGDPDPARAGRAMEAMMQMGKLDIAELEKAANEA